MPSKKDDVVTTFVAITKSSHGTQNHFNTDLRGDSISQKRAYYSPRLVLLNNFDIATGYTPNIVESTSGLWS